jgi:amidohydrolase
MSDWKAACDTYVASIRDRLVSMRRHLHAHPEPSGEEFETSRYVAQVLADAGLHPRVVAGGRGVIVEPPDQGDGPRITVRGDIDALRLHDQKDVEYRSTKPGIAHACGHDAHTSIILGTALTLSACAKDLPDDFRWRAIFQPAEETSEGAVEMVADGATDNVSAILGLHVDPEREIGHFGFCHGTMTAYCNEVDIVIRGEGGHAARPHSAVDPIAAAVQLISSLYLSLPRSVDSRDPSVITFGSIHGGDSRNVIPHEVRVGGTARTHSAKARDILKERIVDIAKGVEAGTRTSIDIRFKPGPDAVINDPIVTRICERAIDDLFGSQAVELITTPSMGGEDFAEYLAKVPGCFFRLGAARTTGRTYLLHSEHFDLDDDVLVVGTRALVRCALEVHADGGGRQQG